MATKAAPAAAKPAAEKKAVAAAPVAAAARPLVTVHSSAGAATKETVKLPHVLLAPIRPDIVQFVHTSMSKNRRQAYAVSYNTGMQHAAESWGTGRAVARVPRISGGGTSRSGQAAFANMVRGGRMFAPTKIWRKWHRKINVNQKRFAVASALAASAIGALVEARGHKIAGIPEVPLVLNDDAESIQKTKQAVAVLKAVGAYADVEKAKESRKLRAGVGKMRNRRHVQRRGPLVVFNEDKGISQAFRNLPGVELAQVDRLNLLQLAPGGHLGRFVIWTKSALARLDKNWGSADRVSSTKAGYTLPRPIMLQSDLTRLINSDEVQSKVRPAIKTVKRSRTKKNPLTNLGAMVTLNPYALALRRSEILTSTRRAAARKAAVEAKRAGKPVAVAKNAAEAIAADKKAAKKHAPAQSKNYARLAAVGNPDRKPVVIETSFIKPSPVKAPKAGAKPAAAAPAAAAKPVEAAKPAAAPAAKPADKKEDKKAAAPKADAKADKKADKKADAKGDKKADAKKTDAKAADKKADAKAADKKADPKAAAKPAAKEGDAAAAERKSRAPFRKFFYRGLEVHSLLDLTHAELMKLMTSRVRRRFARGQIPMGLVRKLRKEKNAAAKSGEKPRTIKTHHRNMIIVPEMVGSMIGVYNGLNFTQVEVKPDMIGHYLGEFAITYKPVKHGRAGVGATSTAAKFIPLK